VLGSAAGGRLPQWNCTCRQCEAARAGRIPRRTQSCIAVAGRDAGWWLVNASPDIAQQLETLPRSAELPVRHNPVRGVFLTNADLDHVLGLPLLREGGCITVFAPAAVRRAVAEGLQFDRVLASFGGIDWRPLDEQWTPLEDSLRVRVIPLPMAKPPRYRDASEPGIHGIAYEFSDETTGGRAVIAPDVPEMTDGLHAAMQEADAVFIDGTFWSDDELPALGIGGRTAADMGHLPVSGSLPVLQTLSARHKLYVHINNTNPMLQPDSPERPAVEAAGVIVGYDGWEAEI
jgi:pyrroloquinoline quinone biosynthesis protein B